MIDALGRVSSVLVFGGTSDIALATLRRLVDGGATRIVLAGRDLAALEAAGTQFTGAQVDVLAFDAAQTGDHAALVDKAFALLGDVDLTLLAFGVLEDQTAAEADPLLAVRMATVNHTGVVSIASLVATRLKTQGHGVLALLSSVAAERARRANYAYGASKAGADAFVQGLGHALAGTGPRAMIIRPGFVRTKLTAGMPEAPFSTDVDVVARAICEGLAKQRDIVWAPGKLRWVMTVLRHLPTPLFRRLPG